MLLEDHVPTAGASDLAGMLEDEFDRLLAQTKGGVSIAEDKEFARVVRGERRDERLLAMDLQVRQTVLIRRHQQLRRHLAQPARTTPRVDKV